MRAGTGISTMMANVSKAGVGASASKRASFPPGAWLQRSAGLGWRPLHVPSMHKPAATAEQGSAWGWSNILHAGGWQWGVSLTGHALNLT